VTCRVATPGASSSLSRFLRPIRSDIPVKQKLPSLDSLTLDLASLDLRPRRRYICGSKYRPPRARRCTISEPLDLTSPRIRRCWVFGAQYSSVKPALSPKAEKPQAKPKPPPKSKPVKVAPRPVERAPGYYEPTLEEIEARKAELRARHPSEILRPRDPKG
jgi:hypothetical protein